MLKSGIYRKHNHFSEDDYFIPVSLPEKSQSMGTYAGFSPKAHIIHIRGFGGFHAHVISAIVSSTGWVRSQPAPCHCVPDWSKLFMSDFLTIFLDQKYNSISCSLRNLYQIILINNLRALYFIYYGFITFNGERHLYYLITFLPCYAMTCRSMLACHLEG